MASLTERLRNEGKIQSLPTEDSTHGVDSLTVRVCVCVGCLCSSFTEFFHCVDVDEWRNFPSGRSEGSSAGSGVATLGKAVPVRRRRRRRNRIRRRSFNEPHSSVASVPIAPSPRRLCSFVSFFFLTKPSTTSIETNYSQRKPGNR